MEDDNAWVFDSLICFLNGPEWNAPLQSFIDEKSLIFETYANDNEEHSKVYEEFKNLVDFMLGNFMEDLGITPQQFEDACNRQSTEKIPIPFDQNLFDLIWAANDYAMFKKTMSQKNIELQLEALDLIERKYGKTPESYVPRSGDNGEDVDGKLDDVPSINKSADIEDVIKKEVAKTFPREDDENDKEAAKHEVEFIQREKKVLENTLKEIDKVIEKELMSQVENQKDAATRTGAIRKGSQQIEAKESANPPKPYKKEIFDRPPLHAEVDEVELKKRQQYLRAQRDKLVAMKKDIRKKHLTVDPGNAKDRLMKRPKSAKAAEALLTGSGDAKVEPQQLELRKTLIERLKNEVVQQKH